MGTETMDLQEQTYRPEQTKVKKWAALVESDIANFFTNYQLEKMSLEDGNGQKAKLSRLKDGGIKVEYTSSVTL